MTIGFESIAAGLSVGLLLVLYVGVDNSCPYIMNIPRRDEYGYAAIDNQLDMKKTTPQFKLEVIPKRVKHTLQLRVSGSRLIPELTVIRYPAKVA